MTERWHVAFTDSRCEQEACNDIIELGFPAYSPQERHKRFKNGCKIIYEAALFPRYLFCRFNSEDNTWPEILACDGVCGILTNQGQPSAVPEPVVPRLMRMQQNGLFDFTQAPNPFPPKSKVELDDDGPFAGLIAEVRRVRSNDRCDVLLRWLGREMMVNVPMARLSHI